MGVINSMKKDWSKMYKKYKGMWVAILGDQLTVVGFGKSAKSALESAKKKGHKDVFLNKIPKAVVTYIG